MSPPVAGGDDVLRTWDQHVEGMREPLIVLDELQALLDGAGLGSGPLITDALGDGHSNVTYRLNRRDRQLVLRRPPRGPLPPSAHDVVREAKILDALWSAGLSVPHVLLVCEDPSLIGAPFYLTDFIEGHVLTLDLPSQWDGDSATLIAEQTVDALVQLHAIDVEASGLASFGRSTGYLERQIRRFRGLLADGATRKIPELETLGDWLAANRPLSSHTTFVHGDFRLGNLMFSGQSQPHLTAVMDWEMATVGDPLADLGYLTATWAQEGDPDDPMLELSPVTRTAGFPLRSELVATYERLSGRDTSAITWYQVLALWKAAIFLERSYRRFLDGSTDDQYFERLGHGVPFLAERAGKLTGC